MTVKEYLDYSLKYLIDLGVSSVKEYEDVGEFVFESFYNKESSKEVLNLKLKSKIFDFNVSDLLDNQIRGKERYFDRDNFELFRDSSTKVSYKIIIGSVDGLNIIDSFYTHNLEVSLKLRFDFYRTYYSNIQDLTPTNVINWKIYRIPLDFHVYREIFDLHLNSFKKFLKKNFGEKIKINPRGEEKNDINIYDWSRTSYSFSAFAERFEFEFNLKFNFLREAFNLENTFKDFKNIELNDEIETNLLCRLKSRENADWSYVFYSINPNSPRHKNQVRDVLEKNLKKFELNEARHVEFVDKSFTTEAFSRISNYCEQKKKNTNFESLINQTLINLLPDLNIINNQLYPKNSFIDLNSFEFGENSFQEWLLDNMSIQEIRKNLTVKFTNAITIIQNHFGEVYEREGGFISRGLNIYEEHDISELQYLYKDLSLNEKTINGKYYYKEYKNFGAEKLYSRAVKYYIDFVKEKIRFSSEPEEKKPSISLITSTEINKELLLSMMKKVYDNLYSDNYSILHAGNIDFDSSSNQNFLFLVHKVEKSKILYLYFNFDKDQTYLFSKSLIMKIDSLQFFRENKFCNFNLGRLEKNGVSLFNFSESKDEISHDYTKNLSEFYNSKTSIFSFKILDTDKNFILDSDYKKNFSLNEITPYYEGKSLIVKNKIIHDYETTIVENSSIKIEKANSNEIKLSEEKIKDVKKILRGVYLKALFNISESVGVIHFNELKLLCIDEIEWIVRNENPDFDDSQISKIMAYVNSVKDKSIVTTIRKCITGVGESIWDRIKDKKLMKVYRLFKVVNGEKSPKKMLLASYNFQEGSSEKHHNRFQTVNDFEALDLINKEIYYKSYDNHPRYTALITGKGKVKFENKLMSLSKASSIIEDREREIFQEKLAYNETL